MSEHRQGVDVEVQAPPPSLVEHCGDGHRLGTYRKTDKIAGKRMSAVQLFLFGVGYRLSLTANGMPMNVVRTPWRVTSHLAPADAAANTAAPAKRRPDRSEDFPAASVAS